MNDYKIKVRIKAWIVTIILFISIFQGVPGFEWTDKAKAATNPYPTEQNVDEDAYIEIPCTWFAWQHVYNNLGIALPAWGNAGGWLDAAASSGYVTGTTPKEHSIAVWKTSGGSNNWGHVAFVNSVSGSNMVVSEGGRTDIDHTSSQGIEYDCTVSSVIGSVRPTNNVLIGFIYLGETDTTSPTISNVQTTDITKDGYTVTCTVSDNVGVSQVSFPSWNTDIHEGGDANWLTGTVSGNTASVRVNLSDLKSGEVQGNYTTHIYACDSSGNQSMSSVIVYIDRTAPEITDAKVVSVDSQGYVVECTVTDDYKIDRVQFPTWTDADGHDDIAEDWGTNTSIRGTADGNVYRFRVKRSEHNDEFGLYHTHIYAYDTCNNSVIAGVKCNVSTGLQAQRTIRYGNSLLTRFEESLAWESLLSYSEIMKSSLVTIKNEEKQAEIEKLLGENAYCSSYYIGAKRIDSSEEWEWLDGEKLDYQNWNEGEPNNTNNEENYIAVKKKDGTWNDVVAGYENIGFMLETSLDMAPSAMVVNGQKRYEIYEAALPYSLACRFAQEKGGKLAIITSEELNNILVAEAAELTKEGFYLGATDEETEGTFLWNDSTEISYANWRENEPNNSSQGGQENYIALYQDGTWNDVSYQNSNIGFIIEFDVEDSSDAVLELKEDSIYEITDSGLLLGIKAEENLVSEIAEQFTSENLVFVDKNNKELADDEKVETGTKIQIVVDGVVTDECEVVIVGDVFGDGELNNKDISMMSRQKLGKESFSKAQILAGDIYEDGSINNKDISKLARLVLGKE